MSCKWGCVSCSTTTARSVHPRQGFPNQGGQKCQQQRFLQLQGKLNIFIEWETKFIMKPFPRGCNTGLQHLLPSVFLLFTWLCQCSSAPACRGPAAILAQSSLTALTADRRPHPDLLFCSARPESNTWCWHLWVALCQRLRPQNSCHCLPWTGRATEQHWCTHPAQPSSDPPSWTKGSPQKGMFPSHVVRAVYPS